MYISIKALTPKCVTKADAKLVLKALNSAEPGESIRIDFFGIVNVSDEFVYGIFTKCKPLLTSNNFYYVRTPKFIERKIKKIITAILS